MREGNKRRIVIVAACALVDGEGRLLIARRPAGKPLAGLWEFPGGKVETDEAPEAALIRELREELALEIAKDDLKPLTFASHAYPDFHLLMPVYLCRKWQGSVTPLEGQEILWVKPSELHAYDMPPADEPLKTTLSALL
ncbi:MAG: (deoxy)nucleoside triphosphate pyrophosphohydrolase [Methyloceanibacter sp.]